MSRKTTDYIYLMVGFFFVMFVISSLKLFTGKERPSMYLSQNMVKNAGHTQIILGNNLEFDFPLGTSSDVIIKAFEKKGFTVSSNLLNTKYTAVLDKEDGACEAHYKITWTNSTDGGVQNIQTFHSNTCS